MQLYNIEYTTIDGEPREYQRSFESREDAEQFFNERIAPEGATLVMIATCQIGIDFTIRCSRTGEAGTAPASDTRKEPRDNEPLETYGTEPMGCTAGGCQPDGKLLS
jgi:hypothetical protein